MTLRTQEKHEIFRWLNYRQKTWELLFPKKWTKSRNQKPRIYVSLHKMETYLRD